MVNFLLMKQNKNKKMTVIANCFFIIYFVSKYTNLLNPSIK